MLNDPTSPREKSRKLLAFGVVEHIEPDVECLDDVFVLVADDEEVMISARAH